MRQGPGDSSLGQLAGHPGTDRLDLPAGPCSWFLLRLDLGLLNFDAALHGIAGVAVAVAAAAELELGPDLVQRSAVARRDSAGRNLEVDIDAGLLAALPVAQPELLLQRIRQDVGKVEVFPVADSRESEVEAPVAADAPPQPALELDAEADREGLVAFDDGVVGVLVVVEDVGIPVCLQLPR